MKLEDLVTFDSGISRWFFRCNLWVWKATSSETAYYLMSPFWNIHFLDGNLEIPEILSNFQLFQFQEVLFSSLTQEATCVSSKRKAEAFPKAAQWWSGVQPFESATQGSSQRQRVAVCWLETFGFYMILGTKSIPRECKKQQNWGQICTKNSIAMVLTFVFTTGFIHVFEI